MNSLLKEFRMLRNQTTVPPSSVSQRSREKKSKSSEDKNYKAFLRKYRNLANTVDSFKAPDLMYFFRQKARENGVNYVIANKMRDLGIFKNLLKRYKPSDICLMIEFIFESNQNYLDKSITQPGVLVSGWCNTIYRDALLWVDDEYVPREKFKSAREKNLAEREWSESDEKISIGEW